MRVFVTDYEAVLRVRAPIPWGRFPGSKLHGMLKRGLDRIDPSVRAQLLAPIVPTPSPYFTLRAGEAAPSALFPVLPRTDTGPEGDLMRDHKLPITLRRFGPTDSHIDRCLESALHYLDDGLIVEPGSWRSPRGRLVEVDERRTQDTRVSLDFITPVHLKVSEEKVEDPKNLRSRSRSGSGRRSRSAVPEDVHFKFLIKVVRRRLEAVCALYGVLPPDVSTRFRNESLPLAEKELVPRIRSTLQSVDWKKFQSRNQGLHKVNGLLGDVDFEGDLGPFVPTLVAAQELHIGSGVSWGLGRFALARGPDGSPADT